MLSDPACRTMPYWNAMFLAPPTRPWVALAAVALATWGGACADEASAPIAAGDSPSVETGASSSAKVSDAPVVELAQFVASWDPRTSALSFALDAPAIDASALRGVPQALYCERRLTSGRPDTFGLATLSGSIGYTPSECGLPDEFPYSSTGAFCATVAVTSYFGERVDAVYAEVTGVVPDTGYSGYRFPFGTGVDPTTVVAGANQPSDAAGGLWAYGAIEPGETVAVPWVLQYEPGPPFWISGRVVAVVPERINGVDDNCDGDVDEPPYADGEGCADGAACLSGYCEAGLCVSSPTTCPPDTWGPTCTPCNCDDGQFCNGVEACDADLGCQAGVAPSVDDGVACTVDACIESTDTIEHAPSDALCDDGNACTADLCDVFGGCSNALVPDGDPCTGCIGGACACRSGACVSGEPDGFVRIEAGSFIMGVPDDELGRYGGATQHPVTLTQDFYLQETEVTQAEWQALMGTNPSTFRGCPTCPVETLNWWEAVSYANARSEAEGLPACYTLSGCDPVPPGNDMECEGVTVNAPDGNPYACTGYRLPMEAEWEYAARAGTTTATYAGNLTATDCTDRTLPPIAWFCGNAGDRSNPVGTKQPNAWGLYDMLGNVYEWTWDRNGAYPTAATDPTGSETGGARVNRGGSWRYNSRYVRAGYRSWWGPGFRFIEIGFRLAKSAP